MQKIIKILRKLHILQEEGYADKPRKWNCCEALVTPNNLEGHIKENHMTGYNIFQ